MKQIIHVAQDAIRKNTKGGTNDPAIIVRDYKGVTRANEVELIVNTPEGGVVVGRFVYRPHNPMSCGARLWLELDTDVCVAVAI